MDVIIHGKHGGENASDSIKNPISNGLIDNLADFC
jgi:hypothetical protein